MFTKIIHLPNAAKPSRCKTEIKIIGAAIVSGLILTLGIGMTTEAYSDKTTEGLSQKFIRFHVLANSDAQADQSLKLKVRDGVLKSLEKDIEKCRTIEETRAFLSSSFIDIQNTAEAIIKDNGFDYDARVSLSQTMFPTKNYGDVILVAGMYEALRIEIGEAKGENWWCVVYPPLCYVDVAQGTLSETKRAQLHENLSGLTDEEYRLVTESDEMSVKVKFKVIELWQEHKLAKEQKLAKAAEKAKEK